MANCSECGNELKPAPAKFDGEYAEVGFLPCPNHPKAPVSYKRLGIINNTMPALFEEICRRLET